MSSILRRKAKQVSRFSNINWAAFLFGGMYSDRCNNLPLLTWWQIVMLACYWVLAAFVGARFSISLLYCLDACVNLLSPARQFFAFTED